MNIRQFIKENPREAQVLITSWQNFVRDHSRNYQDLLAVQKKGDWISWIEKHPEFSDEHDMWMAKEVLDAFLEDQTEPQPLSPQKTAEEDKNEQAVRQRNVRNILRALREEIQKTQSQPRLQIPRVSRGMITRGINTFNKLANGPRSLGSSGISEPQEKASQYKNLIKTARLAIRTTQWVARLTPLLANPVFWIILGIIIVLLFVVVIISSLGPGGPSGPGNNNPNTSRDIASCKFTRSDQNPKEASFQSQKLLGYIQEASNKSSIPSVVFAAFIRVESPGSVKLKDEEIDSFCPESGDGALGIMQLIPHFSHRTDAICLDCLQNGANYLGLSVNQLTREDYCNPQKNLIIGAGFILKKMQYLGYGDGTHWDESWTTNKDALRALAKAYYGCSYYPSCSAGPHDYGEDLYISVSSCQPAPSNNTGPHTTPPPPPSGLAEGIKKEFGITLNGFDQNHLQWAWEKFWDVSNTKFIELARGTEITATSELSEQLGCKQIILNPRTVGTDFKVVLLHELGHIVDHCNPDPISRSTEQAQIFAKEGGITGYAIYSCYGTPPVNEDYAEMITYYLNPGVSEVINCHKRDQVPFAEGRYPLHYNLAQGILGTY